MVTTHRQLIFGLLLVTFLGGCSGRSPVATETLPGTSTPGASTSHTVHITSTGFEPAEIQVTKGTTVTWINDDQSSYWVASDPHPIHTGLPGFDAQSPIAPGKSYQFTFQKVGSWPYHDHLRPVTYTGLVVVTNP